MDVLSYYQNDRCLLRFHLYRDENIRNLGTSKTSNEYVLQNINAQETLLKIRFQSGCYQVQFLISEAKLESMTLPAHTWLDVVPEKRIYLPENWGYLIFQPDFVAKKKSKRVATKRRPQSKAKFDLPPTTLIVPENKPDSLAAKNKNRAPQQDLELPPTLLIKPEQKKPLPQKKNPKQDSNQLPPTVNMPSITKIAPDAVHVSKRIAPADFELFTNEKKANLLLGEQDKSDSNEIEQDTIIQASAKNELSLAIDPVLDQAAIDDSSDLSEIATLIAGDKQKKEKKELKWVAGRYRVIELLGKGGMGIVYKVMDEKLKRVIALKLLISQEKESLEATQRFMNEARSMARLHHKNVVGVHDIGMHEGSPYFTMDFVEGEELQTYLKTLKPRQAMQWMVSICNAIHYIHQCGVIHRDIKPSNVMISKDGTPILMDFGIARDEEHQAVLTAAGQSIGTPAYMAPEQAKGKTDAIDVRTDVYGLGALLYEMLTKKPPFSGPPMQVLYKVCTEDPVPIHVLRPSIPKDVTIIVENAMFKEKQFRYSCAKDMAEDIERYLEGLRIQAQPPAWHIKTFRKFRQNRRLSYVLAIGAFLTLGILAYTTYTSATQAAAHNRQITQYFDEAKQALQKASKESDAIASFIKASDIYTKILVLEPDNTQARQEKFETTLKMAEYALHKLHDYNFARTIYNSALSMGMQTERVIKAQKELEQMEKQEQHIVDDLLKRVFERLADAR